MAVSNTYEELAPRKAPKPPHLPRIHPPKMPPLLPLTTTSTTGAMGPMSTASTVSTIDGGRDRRPDEPGFRLGIEPPGRIVFTSNELGEVPVDTTVSLKNPTAHRQAFKIKCTDNRFFRIVPSFGFIEIGETLDITLTFMGTRVPRDDLHFFTFYHCIATHRTLKKRMFHSMDPEGVTRMLVAFRAKNGKPFKEYKQGKRKKHHRKEPEPTTEASGYTEYKDRSPRRR